MAEDTSVRSKVNRVAKMMAGKTREKSAPIKGRTPQPKFLRDEDDRRARIAGKGTVQDVIDRILAASGTQPEFVARAVEAGLDADEARSRVNVSLHWYRKGMMMQKLPHGKEKLVHVKP